MFCLFCFVSFCCVLLCFVCLFVCFFLYDFAEFAASELQTVTMFLCGTSEPGAVVDNCHPSYSRPRFLAGDGLQV